LPWVKALWYQRCFEDFSPYLQENSYDNLFDPKKAIISQKKVIFKGEATLSVDACFEKMIPYEDSFVDQH